MLIFPKDFLAFFRRHHQYPFFYLFFTNLSVYILQFFLLLVLSSHALISRRVLKLRNGANNGALKSVLRCFMNVWHILYWLSWPRFIEQISSNHAIHPVKEAVSISEKLRNWPGNCILFDKEKYTTLRLFFFSMEGTTVHHLAQWSL